MKLAVSSWLLGGSNLGAVPLEDHGFSRQFQLFQRKREAFETETCRNGFLGFPRKKEDGQRKRGKGAVVGGAKEK